MQHRMKTHPLSQERIDHLLQTTSVASVATLNADGMPYITPVHFVYYDHRIYFHGLPKGQKIDNIKRNPNIGFTIYDMQSYLFDPDEKPCDTNTKYESVIISGKAKILDDFVQKKDVLEKIVAKYTPQLSDKKLPEAMIRGTAVIQMDILTLSGKYYDQ